MQKVSKANWQAEQEPDLSTTKPDEIFDNQGERVTEQINLIDVDTLDAEDTQPDEANKEK